MFWCLDSSLADVSEFIPANILVAKASLPSKVWASGRPARRQRRPRIVRPALLQPVPGGGEVGRDPDDDDDENLALDDASGEHDYDGGESDDGDGSISSGESFEMGGDVDPDDDLWLWGHAEHADVWTVAEMCGWVEDVGQGPDIAGDAGAEGVEGHFVPPAPAPQPAEAPSPAEVLLEPGSAPVPLGVPHGEPIVPFAPLGVPHDAPIERGRRANGDGWPRVHKPLEGVDQPAKGWSWIRRSVNNMGYWDFRASCGWCGKTMSRTAHPSERSSMKALGQGRPLGLLWAWLDFADRSHGAACGAGGRDHAKHWPSFEVRSSARQAFGAIPDFAAMLSKERVAVPRVRDSLNGEPFDLF
jgi:hypothetical protein